MRLLRPRRPIPAFALAILLLAALFGSAQPRTAAAKNVGGCRKDPVVFLSNGVRLQISARILTEATNVKQVTYTVRASEGVTITQVMYPGGPLSANERVLFVADMPADRYGTETLVEIFEGDPVAVHAHSSVGGVRKTVSGFSGERLTAELEVTQETKALGVPSRRQRTPLEPSPGPNDPAPKEPQP
ncbi:MAG TPA: hypothetical protein VER55_10000 [Ardenticatenaceae bacterium]|nr:hypothetical protein [Ardenticatenaceae bacterium]